MTEENKQSLLQRLGVALGLVAESTAEIALATYKTKDGQDINVNDQDQTTDAPDGEYELEDGTTLVVSNGVAAVKQADDQAGATEVETPEEEKQEDEAMANMQAAIEDLINRVSALEGKNAQLEKSNTELSEKLSAVEAKPADKKVVLNAAPEQKSKAQLAFERAQARN